MSQHKQKTYLTYALDADGKLVHVNDVSTGLSCNCFCPHCKSELVAKNDGNRRVHHFAHINGSDCVGAIESALHKMAKDILKEHKLVMLPAVHRNETGRQMSFCKVEAETFDKELSLRPDCVGYRENGQFVWIEFKRTHEVDVKKAGKIVSAKIDCVEIDLNSCELDPIKVRHFIETCTENRKWIYNYEVLQEIQDDEEKNRFRHAGLNGNYWLEQKKRHIAIDEQNTIVNLYILDEIDVNKHTYFCIACGKEVFIKVDDTTHYSFVHLDENTSCEDDFYLHEAAKKMLLKKFYTQQKFDVYIPQSHLCEKMHQCSLFEEDHCFSQIPTCYDLKAHGYDSCEIEYKLPNEQFPYDVVFKRGDDLKTAILIVIDADTCHIEHENIKNRAIEVVVRYESDVFRLYEKPLRGGGISFFNFKNGKKETVACKEVAHDVLKFTLYSSGKYYLGMENCMSESKSSAIYEMIIPHGIENYRKMKKYAILHCYKNQKILRLCEICYYLKTSCYGYICAKNELKRTSSNLLERMPVKCMYFSLNRRLEVDLQKEYYGMKFIERDLTEK